jgi:two-component system sensor histidine kinase KdpD
MLAATSTALLTGVLVPFREEVGLLNVGLLFLLLTLGIASVWGRGAGFFTAVITNLSLNFFFVQPYHTFNVHEPRNVGGLVIFLIVSLLGGSLLSAARQAAAQARRRQAETEVALTLSRAMSGEREPDEALKALCQEVVRAFDAPGAAVLTGSGARWSLLAHAGSDAAARVPDTEERAAAERAVLEGTVQSFGGTGLSRHRARIVFPAGRRAAYENKRSFAMVPLTVGGRVMGVLRLDGPIGNTPFRDQPEQLLSAVASEAALALEREALALEAAHAQALREADEMKSALMASVSHDLKTPLAAITGAIASVMDKSVRWSQDDIDAFNETIASQSDRLNRLISDILDLNRIESGSLKPEQDVVRARGLLESVRDVTAPQTKGREITVEAETSLQVLTDEALIRQALVNLVENAAKYSMPRSAIHLRAAAKDGQVVFAVEDEGPGIAPQDLPYVFERFYRAEEHSRRVRGSGLGLTIVKAFVELCGGKVGVESSPRGTRFEITLPAAITEKAIA